jgi:branched-chain amino acid aminotransferase
MLDTRGFIAETNATHVFLVDGGRLRTPRLVACPKASRAARSSTSVARTTSTYEATDLTLTQAYGADEMFCTGTMGELAAVTRLDGRVIGEGRPGPLTQRLSELFRTLTAREGTLVV